LHRDNQGVRPGCRGVVIGVRIVNPDDSRLQAAPIKLYFDVCGIADPRRPLRVCKRRCNMSTVVDRASDRTAHIVPGSTSPPVLLRDFLHRTAFAEANLRLTIEVLRECSWIIRTLKLALSAPTTISRPAVCKPRTSIG